MQVIGKLLFSPIAPSFTFLISKASTQFQGNPSLGEGAKILGQSENSVIFD